MTVALDLEAGEDLLDEQPVIEDDVRDDLRALLIGQVEVRDTSESGLVPISENTAELVAGGLNAARNDQSGVAEVNDPDLPAFVDAPPVTQLRGQVRLTTMRHLGGGGTGHALIVSGDVLQGNDLGITRATAALPHHARFPRAGGP